MENNQKPDPLKPIIFFLFFSVKTKDSGPRIMVWDAMDMKLKCNVKLGEGKLARGVNALKFSCDGKYVMAAALDDDHTIFIIKIGEDGVGKVLTSVIGGKEKVGMHLLLWEVRVTDSTLPSF